MVHFSPNVRFSEAQAMAVLIRVAESVFAAYGYDLWITSGVDGVHSPSSLHGKGLALDIRTKHVDKVATRVAIHSEIRYLLGPVFDVILEDREGLNEHIHIEYDPNHDNRGGKSIG